MFEETIAAISTPLGQGAIGIVRLCGPEALDIAKKIFHSTKKKPIIESHRVYLGQIIDPVTQLQLDQALLLYMQAPHSYTGEDMVELHCHGGSYLLKSVLNLLYAHGAQPAGKGEFSKRAFLNGKLDLTQAEAVFELIHSRSARGLNQAAYQLEGHLSQPLRDLRTQLLHLLAAIEANIDFPDEVDPPDPYETSQTLEKSLVTIERLLLTAQAGKIWKAGIKLAIIGQPNVGKSTLLNRLLRYDRAIVSDIPGTTRDTVEDDYNLRGIPITMVDTAGLRETTDTIESIGIARSFKTLENADMILWVMDSTQGFGDYEESLLPQIKDKACIIVMNKIDQAPPPKVFLPYSVVPVSASQGIGLEELENQIYQKLMIQPQLDYEVSINERHQLCLLRAKEALERAQSTAAQGLPEDFLAIDLKESITAFGEILGESISEEVIHEIFHRFCVGK